MSIQQKSVVKDRTCTPTEGKDKPDKKNVQFKDSCRIRLFRMVDDSEQSLVWYNPKEYKEFKRERKAAVQLCQAIGEDQVERTDFVSCRGVEYMLDETRLSRKVNTWRRAQEAVFAAQLKEFLIADETDVEPNMVECQAISIAYSKFSKQAHWDASQRAIKQWNEFCIEYEPTRMSPSYSVACGDDQPNTTETSRKSRLAAFVPINMSRTKKPNKTASPPNNRSACQPLRRASSMKSIITSSRQMMLRSPRCNVGKGLREGLRIERLQPPQTPQKLAVMARVA